MPTPVDAFARAAAEHGGVDPDDVDAVQDWYAETVPKLPPERLEALLEDLLSRDGEPTNRPLRPSYPGQMPLPRLEASPPAPLPLLAAGWLALIKRLARRAQS